MSSTTMKVPTPVKWVFDRFPVVQYQTTPQSKAIAYSDTVNRCFEFRDVKSSMHNPEYDGGNSKNDNSGNDNFQLGVYSVHGFEIGGTDVMLARDPLCLYAQLSLCKKNNLRLPTKFEEGNNEKKNQPKLDAESTLDSHFTTDVVGIRKPGNKVVILSEKAHKDERLPILIETTMNGQSKNIKRYVRSMDSIMIILDSKLESSELAIGNLLDTTVYDAFLLCTIHNNLVYETYGCSPDTLHTLSKRNRFFTRHPQISSLSLGQIYTPSPSDLEKQLAMAKDILLLLQSTHDKFSDYLRLKVASYVLALLHLPSFGEFLRAECSKLLDDSTTIVKDFL
ncbi:uncharacterized protein CGFF_03265 [Nakaseomyces glabratus]|nr:SAM35, subunit of SAM coomplex [Nakaseomyces glabratus]QNG14224.1 uncharacterized protein GWK60_H01947 [Nakaseomyces glabratus]SCV15708.1 uncharacterized protein CGFF_03265 [Nakaseomyces glabratus]SLM15137.1 uncharacterized protein CGFF_03265 [Nakaseomyces glabratus]